ncbi:hypothetical protein MUS1_04170 [Marinomonas ushuaiensis DSM 15871]|uniref:Outer membrane protein beta-barrel domain-containing protein n=1 Tax=Marinomonas ushuaiensis DSM 15871 TaxID=1122207 RepID=X7E2L3_9GAMM|nr:outer membrane beta-barrel protein [Marinomonas ushuaiensis]ETX10120.1 hypothetical protein MUS1_04170 [Marinomonas ushuaiensis DSM 15871]
MKKVILTSALLLSVSTVYAAEAPRWNFLSGSYGSGESDDIDYTGLNFSGNKLINDNVFIAVGFSTLSGDYDYSSSVNVDVDQSILSVGVGYREGINTTTDLFSSVSFLRASITQSATGYVTQKDSDTGFNVKLGARSMISDEVELMAAIYHTEYESGRTGVTIGALYNVNSEFSIGADYDKSDDTSSFSLGAYYFY